MIPSDTLWIIANRNGHGTSIEEWIGNARFLGARTLTAMKLFGSKEVIEQHKKGIVAR